MANLADLRSDILPSVAGCPTVMVDDAILKTVIDFCNRSRAYRITSESIATAPGVGDYDPDIPNGTVIAWLLSATLDGMPLNVEESGGVALLDDGTSGTPTKAILVSETEVGLRRIPDSVGSLKVSLALRPSKTAKTYPDDLHALYQEHIAAGVLARLWAQAKQPWAASGDMVLDARNRYEAAISAAEYRADRGSSSHPARTALSLIGGR